MKGPRRRPLRFVRKNVRPHVQNSVTPEKWLETTNSPLGIAIGNAAAMLSAKGSFCRCMKRFEGPRPLLVSVRFRPDSNDGAGVVHELRRNARNSRVYFHGLDVARVHKPERVRH